MSHPRLRSLATLAFLCAATPTAGQSAARPAAPPCVTSFHVASSDRQGVRWDTPTSEMQKWWTRNPVPGLCYTSDPQAADYVLVWHAETITVRQDSPVDPGVPIGFDTPVPPPPIVGSAAASTPNTRNARRVTVAVYSRGAPDAALDLVWRDPTFSVSSTGNWPWSKPDRDALMAAVRTLHASHRPRR